MTQDEIVTLLPSADLFIRGQVPGPLTEEERDWLVDQLHAWPKRVNEDRTCAIGALTDMATAEFARLMAERHTAMSTAQEPALDDDALIELEAEARRFAGFYPEGSDGRNTFVIFADKIADRLQAKAPETD